MGGGLSVADVDPVSLTFGRTRAPPVRSPRPRVADVDHDGFADLVVRFESSGRALAAGDSTSCLEGRTRDGIPFHGCDAPPGRRSAAASGRSWWGCWCCSELPRASSRVVTGGIEGSGISEGLAGRRARLSGHSSTPGGSLTKLPWGLIMFSQEIINIIKLLLRST